MATLETPLTALKLPNPFVIGSGPPGTNANVICKALEEGWGAVICKTVSLDAGKVVNVQPRYARLRSRESGEIYGWENIELISDRSFETWIDEFKQVKDKYPEGILIASIMEEYNRDAWHEIVERCQDAGCDSFELNMSCPHGLPERKMGAAMGENPDILSEVCGWVMEVAKKPVWAKMTPNVTHIEDPTRGLASRRLRRHRRNQHDSQRAGRRPGHPAAGTNRRRLHHARRLFVPGRDADRLADVHGNRQGDSKRISRQNTQRHRRHRDGQRRSPIHSARVRHRAGLHGRDEIWLPDHP